MKKIYANFSRNLIILGMMLAVLSLSSTAMAQLPQADNILGQWDLDGDADDASPNAYHGTETDDVEYDFVDFKHGTASGIFVNEDADGRTTSIALPTTVGEKDIRTISCWFKLSGELYDNATDLYLFGKDNDIQNVYLRVISPDAASKPGSAKAQWLRQNSAYTNDAVIANDEWTHLAATIIYEGESAVQSHIYINGVKADKGSGTWDGVDGAPADSDSDSPMYIGGKADGGSAFPGLIDQVVVWNVALDSAEIVALYEYQFVELSITSDPITSANVDRPYEYQVASTGLGSFSITSNPDASSWLSIDAETGLVSGTPTAEGSVDVSITFSDGATDIVQDYTLLVSLTVPVSELPQLDKIVGQWNLDGDADDASPNANHGTETDDVEYDFVDFKHGTASGIFVNEDADGKITSVALPTTIGEKDIRSISCWFKLSDAVYDLATDLYILGKDNDIQNVYLRVISPDAASKPGSAKAQWLRQNSAYTNDNVIMNDEWTHLAATIIYEGEKAIQSHIYINGVKADKGSGTWDGEAGAPADSDSDSPMYIGGKADGGSAFPGLIDQVVVWNVALDGDEVWDVYNYSASTVGIRTNELNKDFDLGVYPNPVTSVARISFNVQETSEVSVKIFNAVGAEVGTIANKIYSTGNHIIEWNANDAPAGIYFVQLKQNENVEITKMMLLK